MKIGEFPCSKPFLVCRGGRFSRITSVPIVMDPFAFVTQGLFNFVWYGLNDRLKQAWLQVRGFGEAMVPNRQYYIMIVS